MLEKIVNYFEVRKAYKSSSNYISWLRKKGITIGLDCKIWSPATVTIDLTRPSLIEIGNCVYITANCKILTHGYDWVVLKNKYKKIYASSGPVIIGDNVFIGTGSTVMKGVSIGSNCIIGAGSVVTKSVPSDSVAAGNPAKVICSLDEYEKKRSSEYIEEAKVYAKYIKKNMNRSPRIEDFWEEFPIFLDPSSDEYKKTTKTFKNKIDKQLGDASEYFYSGKLLVNKNFKEFLEENE